MRTRYLAAGLLAAAAAAVAAEPKAEPKAEAKTEQIRVTVVSVSGSAQKMRAGGEKPAWEPLKAGDVLDELTVIRTGFRTKVELKLADRGQVTINSATKMGIREVRMKGTLARTRLGLKYGTIQARVVSETGPSDFRVATPVATLSVRGSKDNFGYSPDGGAQGQSNAGSLTLDCGPKSQTVNPGEGTGSKGGKPIDKKKRKSNADMGNPGQSNTENNNTNYNGGGRGGMGQWGGAGTRLKNGESSSESNHQYENSYGESYRGE